MDNFDVLEINFNTVKSDFENHNVDLYVAKIELETIIRKLTKIQTNLFSEKVQKLLLKAKKLLEDVKHEISIQEKEENLRIKMQHDYEF